MVKDGNVENEQIQPKFDEADLKNVIYKEVIQILEPLESKGKYKGNAHHLTQDIVEKVSAAIMEKMIFLRDNVDKKMKNCNA